MTTAPTAPARVPVPDRPVGVREWRSKLREWCRTQEDDPIAAARRRNSTAARAQRNREK